MTKHEALHFMNVFGCSSRIISGAPEGEEPVCDVLVCGVPCRTPQQAAEMLREKGGNIEMAEGHYLAQNPEYRHELIGAFAKKPGAART
jgi:hypothetical protein